MTTRLLDSFRRVSRSSPCPNCERPDWCLIGKPGTEFDGATICTRIESPHRFGQAGWLHRHDGWKGRAGKRPDVVLPLNRSTPASPTIARIADEARRALSAESLASLSRRLQVSATGLKLLDVGEITPRLAHEEGCSWATESWSFPMRNARGEVVGIRLRKRDGTKLTWPGGREGLFIPSGIDASQGIVLPEGVTDTAAALDLGLAAVGRPSCTGGRQAVLELVRRHKPARVVVVADQDTPGRTGAMELARALVLLAADVRLVAPPESVKDLRAWFIAGATPESLRAAIDSAEPLRISLRRRAGGCS